MQLHTKKVIAREFILFMITIVLVAGAFAGTYIYNFTQNNHALQLDEKMVSRTALADSLAKPYKSKMQNQQWFYDKNNEIVDLTHTEMNSPYKLWQRLDYLAATDSIQIKLDSVWTPEIKELLVTIDFDNPQKLTAFIDKNRLTETDSTDFSRAAAIFTEIEKVKNALNWKNKSKDFDLFCRLEVTIWGKPNLPKRTVFCFTKEEVEYNYKNLIIRNDENLYMEEYKELTLDFHGVIL